MYVSTFSICSIVDFQRLVKGDRPLFELNPSVKAYGFASSPISGGWHAERDWGVLSRQIALKTPPKL